jgi:hypothetical protein
VRANDVSGQGLNWSATRLFRRRLPVPVPAVGNATSSEAFPVLSWSAVDGAVSYDVHVDQVDGDTKDFTVKSTSFTPVTPYGNRIWKWKVRANFPSRSGTVGGPFSPQTNFVHLLTAPTGAKGSRTSKRVLISWNSQPAAKRYVVELAKTNGFDIVFASTETDHTSWAPDLTQEDFKKGGTIYWRVSALDVGHNRSPGATGKFKVPRAVQIELTGALRKGVRGTLGVRVRTTSGGAVRAAKVTVSGLGIKTVTKRTSKKGRARFHVLPRRKGKLVIRVSRSGYQSTRAAYVVG